MYFLYLCNDFVQRQYDMNDLILRTLQGKKTERPAVWFMRQAGRVLPDYLKLRDLHSFDEIMHTPDLCAQVTLMPVHTIGVDAAILFSDILVVPTAMGANISWTDKGPVFSTPLCQYSDASKQLKPDASKLNYIYRNIDEIKSRISDGTPLIGFCGGPLTTLCYMLQGRSTDNQFNDAVSYIFSNPAETDRLIEALTEMTIEYARNQVKHGVQLFQIFETNAGVLPQNEYITHFMPAIRRIGQAVKEMGVPVIYFAKGLGLGLQAVTPDMCDFVSIDWQMDFYEARKLVNPAIGLQGNLDPRILFASEEIIQQKLESYRPYWEEHHNWILNLGHGVPPQAPLKSLQFITNYVKRSW